MTVQTLWDKIGHLPPEILTRLRLNDPSLVLARGRTNGMETFYACLAEELDDGYHHLLDLKRTDWLCIFLDDSRDLLARELRWAPKAEPPWLALVQVPKY